MFNHLLYIVMQYPPFCVSPKTEPRSQHLIARRPSIQLVHFFISSLLTSSRIQHRSCCVTSAGTYALSSACSRITLEGTGGPFWGKHIVGLKRPFYLLYCCHLCAGVTWKAHVDPSLPSYLPMLGCYTAYLNHLPCLLPPLTQRG